MSDRSVFSDVTPNELDVFKLRVWERGRALYRDLPWRRTNDPYAILVSEVMLQQTQVARVSGKWAAWLDAFPTIDALAAAPLPAVLEAWQGLGYNRRAMALKRAAEACSQHYGGTVPSSYDALIALPGIGPATAAGVRAFAFGEPGVYLETNVRSVFLHEFFPDASNVPDAVLVDLVRTTCDEDDPRGWYYALLDYGAWLKKVMPNPSRKSAHHTKQSRFEGSHRQKRAWVLRMLLDAGSDGASEDDIRCELDEFERLKGRDPLDAAELKAVLDELAAEGMATSGADGIWHVAQQ